MFNGNTHTERNRANRNRVKRTLLSTVAGIVIGQGAVGFAAAQDSGDSVSDLSDEIIVTARNRAESIQDVPLAITAFGEDDFTKRNIENLDEVARLTAGLSFEDFSGGFATPIIRGQTQTRITALESNVSVFLDGVYIPRAWAFDLGTSNLTRIEVVKGPQSARYGRNAFAGAINYVPYKATLSEDPISGQATGTVGSDERFDGGIRANLVLGERVAIAGSYKYSTFDGTIGNDQPFTGLELEEGTNGNVGGYENQSFSGSIIVNPIDKLTIEGSFNRFDVTQEARAIQTFSQFADNLNAGSSGALFGFIPFTNSLLSGEFEDPPEEATVDPRASALISDTNIYRASANYEISDALQISYTFGLIEGDVTSAGSSEVDQVNCGLLPFGPPTCAFTASPIGSIDYTSHEARLVYDAGEAWRFELGGFISNGDDVFDTQFFSLPVLVPGVTDPATVEAGTASLTDPNLTGIFTETDITAIFGAFEWRSPDDRFKFNAELRYSENDISGSNLAVPVADRVILNDTFSFLTPRITAEYRVSEESLAYASVARGAKAGGFNPQATLAENQVFDEELNWTYEIGLKNQFWDNRFTLNGAIFYTDWSDLQISSPDFGAPDPFAASITDNLGGATVFGLEVESRLQLSENLSLDGSISYTDAEYDDGVADQRFAVAGACDDIVCPANGDVSGNQIERTPSTQVAFGAQWDGTLPAWDASYYIRGDFSWQSSFFASPINIATIPSRFLLGASAGVTIDRVDASIWVRNLTDENFISNSFVIVGGFGNSYNAFFGERRSFGATVKVNF